MSIDVGKLASLALADQSFSWGPRDVILYCLATGFGRDELDRGELAFIYEGAGMRCPPTFATTLASPLDGELVGLNTANIITLEHELEIFSPLLPADDVVISTDLLDVYDPQDGKGVRLIHRTEGRRQHDSRALFAATLTRLARGSKATVSTEPRAPRNTQKVPARDADFLESFHIRDDQSALFRLCGDDNPAFVDPDAARHAGFERPVVPEQCLLGIACRAVLATVCDLDTTLIRSFSAHFTSPAFGGDDLRISMWQDGPTIAFQVRSESGDRLVVDNGRCMLTT